MNRYFLAALLVFAILCGCRKGAGTSDSQTQDTTSVQLDTLVADTAGVDTSFLND